MFSVRPSWRTALLGAHFVACSGPLELDAKAPSAVADTGFTEAGDTGGTGHTHETGLVERDEDGDGYTVSEGDCDEGNPDIHPGAEELCNGLDDDCDGTSDADLDDDGDSIPDCEDRCPVQVDVRSAVRPDGTWDAPYAGIQDGIDAAGDTACDVVEVAAGVYFENIDYSGIAVRVVSHDGPLATTIDGSSAGPVVCFQAAEGPGSVLEGFTITNGRAPLGAGIFIDSASPTILGNVIELNTVAGDGGGGGIGMSNSSPLVEANIIQLNDACYGGPEEGCDGGAINVRAGAPTIVSNDILDNSAGDGGALWMVRSDALIYWNLIDGNLADDTHVETAGQGGGVDIQVPSPGLRLTNNVITNNVASTHGGGVAVFETGGGTGAQIEHNVIAFNDVTETGFGAGVLVWQYTAPMIRNNLIAWNRGSGVHLNAYGSATYNLMYGNTIAWSGDQGDRTGVDGNISSSPAVVASSDDGDPFNDDWSPASGSALINAGDPGSAVDADGSRADIGAHGGTLGGW